MIRFGLEGKVVAVTGAARGIGRAVAEHLAEEGACVVAGDLDETGAKALAEELGKRGVQAVGCRCDVRRKDDAQALVQAAVSKFGCLDGMVCNAGIRNFARIHEMSEADWDAVIETNLKGVFLTAQAAAAVMAGQKAGSIVSVSSVAAWGGIPQRGNYCAAKAGVSSLTRVMAAELASSGVRVNAVGPGSIDTEMARQNTPEQRARMAGRTPLGRLGEPREVSCAILFLLSEAASYVTGQTLYVDGGWTAAIF